MARRLASCPWVWPPMPSATTYRSIGKIRPLCVQVLCNATRLSSFGLDLRTMPVSQPMPTSSTATFSVSDGCTNCSLKPRRGGEERTRGGDASPCVSPDPQGSCAAALVRRIGASIAPCWSLIAHSSQRIQRDPGRLPQGWRPAWHWSFLKGDANAARRSLRSFARAGLAGYSCYTTNAARRPVLPTATHTRGPARSVRAQRGPAEGTGLQLHAY